MKRFAMHRTAAFLATVLVCFAWGMPARAQEADPPPVADVRIAENVVSWAPTVEHHAIVLTVAHDGGAVLRQRFEQGVPPVFQLRDAAGTPFPDGRYRYELRVEPIIDPATREVLADVQHLPEREEIVQLLIEEGKLPRHALSQSGFLEVRGGAFVVPSTEPEEQAGSTAVSGAVDEDPSDNPPPPATGDVVHNDDLIVIGSLGVGMDCVNGESFGFDTFRLKENNLRIHFDDTSALGGYSARDWRILINDSVSGGADFFAIEDSTGGRVPFKIEGAAPTDALRIDEHGWVGLKTGNPVVELHIADGDTPTVRLEQDGSSGWQAQTWDLAGNERNLFIRDVTHGSKLVLRIEPNTPGDSLCFKSNGRVGLGTWSPEGKLHVVGDVDHPNLLVCQAEGNVGIGTASPQGVLHVASDAEPNILYCESDGKIGIGTDAPEARLHVKGMDGADILRCENNGGVTVFKALSQASDVNLKENFQQVDGQEVLDRLAKLPVRTWNYKGDDDAVRHMGPMAQDFHAAFGLNDSNRTIAPMDLASAAVAAIQELNSVGRKQKEEIEALKRRNASLEARLAAIETRLAVQ